MMQENKSTLKEFLQLRRWLIHSLIEEKSPANTPTDSNPTLAWTIVEGD
jgi:hypothetical protein